MAYDQNVPVEEVAGQNGAETLVYIEYMRTMRITVRSFHASSGLGSYRLTKLIMVSFYSLKPTSILT